MRQSRCRNLQLLLACSGRLFFLICPAGTQAAAQQQTGFLDRTVPLAGKPVRYQVYVPFDYPSRQDWPVILFLHGAGERGTDGLRQTQVGLGPAIRRSQDRFPAIVVMPQAPPESIWRGTVAEMSVAALEQTTKEFRVDRSRTYVVGLSMGGYGAWTLALKHPRRFAAIVAVCGGILPPGHLTELDAGLREKDPYAELARRLGGTPVWLFHGARDSLVPPEESRRIHKAFNKAGYKINYTEYPDVGHESWIPAFGDPMLWDWLFQQRRSGPDE
ncbi:MAG TPA: alpha/beta fold hydrolase [Gemmatimonadales bacterium]|nr:alpha/beta fold hydrolase [Gemmatimonadales bacterium]